MERGLIELNHCVELDLAEALPHPFSPEEPVALVVEVTVGARGVEVAASALPVGPAALPLSLALALRLPFGEALAVPPQGDPLPDAEAASGEAVEPVESVARRLSPALALALPERVEMTEPVGGPVGEGRGVGVYVEEAQSVGRRGVAVPAKGGEGLFCTDAEAEALGGAEWDAPCTKEGDDVTVGEWVPPAASPPTPEAVAEEHLEASRVLLADAQGLMEALPVMLKAGLALAPLLPLGAACEGVPAAPPAGVAETGALREAATVALGASAVAVAGLDDVVLALLHALKDEAAVGLPLADADTLEVWCPLAVTAAVPLLLALGICCEPLTQAELVALGVMQVLPDAPGVAVAPGLPVPLEERVIPAGVALAEGVPDPPTPPAQSSPEAVDIGVTVAGELGEAGTDVGLPRNGVAVPPPGEPLPSANVALEEADTAAGEPVPPPWAGDALPGADSLALPERVPRAAELERDEVGEAVPPPAPEAEAVTEADCRDEGEGGEENEHDALAVPLRDKGALKEAW